MKKRQPKIYIAQAMSGQIDTIVCLRSRRATKLLEMHGMKVLDPVAAEGVKETGKPIAPDAKTLRKFWERDKKMIRKSDALLDLTCGLRSEGVAQEVGFAKGWLKPVVRFYVAGKPGVNALEDDYCTDNLLDAVKWLQDYFKPDEGYENAVH